MTSSLTSRPALGAPPRRRRRWARVAVPVVLVGLGAAAVPFVLAARSGGLELSGLTGNAPVGKDRAGSLALRVTGSRLDAATVTLDGKPATTTREGDALVVRPGVLADGRHELAVTVPGSLPLVGGSSLRRSFVVDTTPPKLDLAAPKTGGSLRDPVDVAGTVEPGTALTLDGKDVAVSGGAFALHFATPPAGAKLVATDRAGNTTTREVTVAVTHPMMRAVHLTALAWSAPSLREPALALAKAGKINTIELDIKDEEGIIGYDSQVPLARQVGATTKIYDAKKVLDQLHGMNLRVVGRLVAFKDPKLGKWAWENNKRDWVVQDTSGQPWAGKYGNYAFTNFSNRQVQQYNIDLATEAAKLGFDDILYDYVRRPDGTFSKMKVPGLTGTPEVAVAKFVADTRGPVRAAGAYLGASVFGIAADRPTQIAQDMTLMGKSLDYVSPMVYPSHWGKGEYGVADPNAQPYEIVNRSLKAFQKDLKGTDTQVFPWLQDFSLGRTYGPAEVRAQIKGAKDDGIDSFLLWNAGARYQDAALDTIPVK